MTRNKNTCKITTLINSIDKPIVIHSAAGAIFYINTAFCKSIGYARKYLQAKTLFHIERKYTQNKLQNACRALLHKDAIAIDGIHQNKKGAKFPVQYSLKCIIIDKQKYYVSTISDMSVVLNAEKFALHHLKFVKLAKEIGASLSSLKDIDLKMNNILQNLGKFVNVERAYIFNLNKNTGLFSNTYEWCAPNAKPFKNSLQNINLRKDYPWIAKKLTKKPETIIVDDVSKLPKSKSVESFVAELKREKVVSILLSPILSEGTVIGFIGFDKVGVRKRW